MPKRKHDDIGYKKLRKKLKKLEKELKRNRHNRRGRADSGSRDSSPDRSYRDESPMDLEEGDTMDHAFVGYASPFDETEDIEIQTVRSAVVVVNTPPVASDPCPSTATAAVAANIAVPAADVAAVTSDVITTISASSDPTAPTVAADLSSANEPLDIDPVLMEILGEDPSINNEFGKEIQKDLAVRLTHIATSGLSKETRKDLKEKYLIPSNCKLIGAPTLNPEIAAILTDVQTKRDKGVENKQKINATAISSLSEAISLLLSSEFKNPALLKLLMDTARLICERQHLDSITRRNFILSTVKKDMKDQIEKTKIDSLLFGENLADTLKTAKAINKSGADLRPYQANKVQNANNKQNNHANRGQSSLNWRGPPPSRKTAPSSGNQRTTTTARPSTRSHPPSSSKTSYRQANTRARR